MKKNKDNVIDITERVTQGNSFVDRFPQMKNQFNNLKVRFDLEQTKIAVSTSLLSIVLLVTVANNGLLNSDGVRIEEKSAGRGIASVSTGTSDAEDKLVQTLATRELSEQASVGRRPTILQNLAFGRLEGKYAIRLQDGKIAEVSFTQTGSETNKPTQVKDLAGFLTESRELLPVAFDRTIRLEKEVIDGQVTEVFQLVDRVSRPLAKVQFRLDSAGGLIGMKVSALQIASN